MSLGIIPASPFSKELRSAEMECRSTPSKLESLVLSPWAKRLPIIQATTSPEPPFAIPGFPYSQTIVFCFPACS